VLVVGNGPSAVDIVRDLRSHVGGLVRCIRRVPLTDELRKRAGALLVPEVKQIHLGCPTGLDANIVPADDVDFGASVRSEMAKPEAEQVWLRLDDGRAVPAPDVLLFATGYRYAFPFLPWLREGNIHGGHTKDYPPVLAADSSHCCNLYHQIYYTPLPTLSFICLQKQVSPFPLMECQAWHVASVLSGQCGLPPLPERRRRLLAEEAVGWKRAKGVHSLEGDLEWIYNHQLVTEVSLDPQRARRDAQRSSQDIAAESRPGLAPEWWKVLRRTAREQRQRELGF